MKLLAANARGRRAPAARARDTRAAREHHGISRGRSRAASLTAGSRTVVDAQDRRTLVNAHRERRSGPRLARAEIQRMQVRVGLAQRVRRV